MRGDDAYAVLGLRPGAGRAEIDQAYRRLIKRYHPDYADGDASRAAELNRAYSELRAHGREAPRAPPPPPAGRYAQLYARPPRRRGLAAGVAAGGAAVLLALGAAMTQTGSSAPKPSIAAESAADSGEKAPDPSLDVFSLDEPLAAKMIESSVTDAIQLHADSDPAQAAQFSRQCLNRLGANPSLPLFDSCAAYDEAIAILAAGNPAFESGAFNPSAVTARQVGAARLLSDDYFGAESRLQQIRSRVHLILLPGIANSGQARQPRALPAVRVPKVAELPAIARAIEARAIETRTTQTRAEPRQAKRRSTAPVLTPQPVRRAEPPSRSPPARNPAPTPERNPAPQPSEPRQTPAWQEPLKPGWQRPLARTGD